MEQISLVIKRCLFAQGICLMPHCSFELEIGLRLIVCTARMTNVSLNNSRRYRSVAIFHMCEWSKRRLCLYVWLSDGFVRHAISR